MSSKFKEYISRYQGPYDIIDSNEAQIFAFTEYIVKRHRIENIRKKYFVKESSMYRLLKSIDPNLCPEFEINDE